MRTPFLVTLDTYLQKTCENVTDDHVSHSNRNEKIFECRLLTWNGWSRNSLLRHTKICCVQQFIVLTMKSKNGQQWSNISDRTDLVSRVLISSCYHPKKWVLPFQSRTKVKLFKNLQSTREKVFRIWFRVWSMQISQHLPIIFWDLYWKKFHPHLKVASKKHHSYLT